jgi:hypothetical protein
MIDKQRLAKHLRSNISLATCRNRNLVTTLTLTVDEAQLIVNLLEGNTQHDAFMAGFLAAPESRMGYENKWRFDAGGSIAADRAQGAYEAWIAQCAEETQ